MEQLIQQICEAFKEPTTDEVHKQWGNRLIEENVNLMDLVTIIYKDKPVSNQFSYMIGGLCETKPEMVAPTITYFFNNRSKINIPHYNRSLAKMFYLVGIPDEIEGAAIDAMFKWLMDPKSNISTKSFSLKCIHKNLAKHPGLKNELITCLEDLDGKNTNSFNKLVRRIFNELTIR